MKVNVYAVMARLGLVHGLRARSYPRVVVRLVRLVRPVVSAVGSVSLCRDHDALLVRLFDVGHARALSFVSSLVLAPALHSVVVQPALVRGLQQAVACQCPLFILNSVFYTALTFSWISSSFFASSSDFGIPFGLS